MLRKYQSLGRIILVEVKFAVFLQNSVLLACTICHILYITIATDSFSEQCDNYCTANQFEGAWISLVSTSGSYCVVVMFGAYFA